MTKNSSIPKPTESELDILQILWERKTATVREVHEKLSVTKDAGYTTTLKLMQIMHDKGMVSRDESNKSHVYRPIISKAKVQQKILGRVVDTFFGGSASQLVIQALGSHTPTQNEIDEIRKFLDQYK